TRSSRDRTGGLARLPPEQWPRVRSCAGRYARRRAGVTTSRSGREEMHATERLDVERRRHVGLAVDVRLDRTAERVDPQTSHAHVLDEPESQMRRARQQNRDPERGELRE